MREEWEFVKTENERKTNEFLMAMGENDMVTVKKLISSYLGICASGDGYPDEKYQKLAINASCKPESRQCFLFFIQSYHERVHPGDPTQCIPLIMTLAMEACIKIKYYEMIHCLVNDYEGADIALIMTLDKLHYPKDAFDFDQLFSPEFNFNKELALEFAIKRDKLDFFKTYIDDVDINFCKGYLLWCAIKFNKTEFASILINYGADVNLRENEYLNMALNNNNLEIMKLIIDAGINLENSLGTKNLKINPIITLLTNNGIDPLVLCTIFYSKLFGPYKYST